MGVTRTAVLTSLVLGAACGGKVIASTDTAGGDPTTGTTGSTGTTTGGVQTTTGTGDPGPNPGGNFGAGGSPAGPTPCGPNVCAAGLACCNASCGICVPPGDDCAAIACGVPIDASVGGAGGSVAVGVDEVAGLKSDFGFTWHDSWFITGCANKQGHDCINIPVCPGGNAVDFEDKGAIVNETFPLGGKMGATYAVSFKFNGLAEGKFYQGGSWAQPAIDTVTPGAPGPQVNEDGIANDTFYVGGTATPSNYNTMRIRVLDPSKKEVARYYMNAYPPNTGAESHRTFMIAYAHTIDVPGRGFIEYRISDSNCHAIDNCGRGNVSDVSCDAARNIPNEPNAVLPALYTDVASPIQPHLVPLGSLNTLTGAKQPWHAQISHFTITRIVAH